MKTLGVYNSDGNDTLLSPKAAASPLDDSKKQKVAGRGHQKFNNDSSTTKCTTTSIVSGKVKSYQILTPLVLLLY